MAFNHPSFRDAGLVKYWVILAIHSKKVVAKERTSDPNKRTEVIEGSLEDIRVRLRAMRFFYRIAFETNPEQIIEVWY